MSPEEIEEAISNLEIGLDLVHTNESEHQNAERLIAYLRSNFDDLIEAFEEE